MNKQPQGMVEGIYFKLSNEAYHNDPALSHSGMVKLLSSWQDFWVNSCHNPNKGGYNPTDAMKFGTRSSMYLLEKDEFYRQFATYNRDGGKGQGIYLSSVEYNLIRESERAIRDVPIGDNYFSDGYPEVSIFWRDEESGIMLRARIDYLRTFGAIDVKRIRAMDNWTIGKAIRDQGLDIQNAHYLEAMQAARRMLRDGYQIDPSLGIDPDWLEAFMNNTGLIFRFVFQRSTRPFIWRIKTLAPDVIEEGNRAIRSAIHQYKIYSDLYGFGSPPLGDGELEEITSFHVPRRNYD